MIISSRSSTQPVLWRKRQNKITVLSSLSVSRELPPYMKEHATFWERSHFRVGDKGQKKNRTILLHSGDIHEYLNSIKYSLAARPAALDLSWTISEFSRSDKSFFQKLETEIKSHLEKVAQLDPNTAMSLHIIRALDKDSAMGLSFAYRNFTDELGYQVWVISNNDVQQGYDANFTSLFAPPLIGDFPI